MASNSNMVRRPTQQDRRVSFGHTTSLYEDGSTSEEETKDCDGPNESTLIFGQIVSGYILGHFTSPDSFRSIYENSLISVKGIEWMYNLHYMIEAIRETGTRSLYYRDYQIKALHLPKLEELYRVIKVAHLEVRYENLLKYMEKEKLEEQGLTCTTTPLAMCQSVPA